LLEGEPVSVGRNTVFTIPKQLKEEQRLAKMSKKY